VTGLLHLVNAAMAGWLVVFAFVVGRERLRDQSYLGSAWGAASWGLLLLAIAVGNSYAITSNLPITPATPIVTAGLVCGLIFHYKALRKGDE
jgi:hypothetical protein